MALAQKIADTPDAHEVAKLVARSRAAQAQIENATQEQVDRWIRGMVWAVAKPGMAEKIAQETIDETQLGNYDGKYLGDVPIGRGCDGAVFNPKTMECYSSQGDGTMTVIKEKSPKSFEVVQVKKVAVHLARADSPPTCGEGSGAGVRLLRSYQEKTHHGC